MIGLDTSHVPAFAKLFNDPKAEGELAGIKVVAGYPGGTDMPASRDRVKKFTENLQASGVEIVDTIPKLLERVDVVLLESVDGRIHLEEAAQVIRAGKPVFIDKPMAGSLADVIAIFELAKKHNVPCFSSSSLRYGSVIQDLARSSESNKTLGVDVWGPCSYQEGTMDLCFYGVHGIEGVFTLMGRGCQTVSRTQAGSADVAVGVWGDGRVGTYRGLRSGKASFGAVVYGDKEITNVALSSAYKDLCIEVARFFHSRKPPIDAEMTIEIFAFMEAADESKRRGGTPVAIAEVLEKAQADARARLDALSNK
jgi:hypothetical protein